MALLPPSFLQAATGDPAITYTAQDYRNLIDSLAPNDGTVGQNDLKVSQRAAGANMSVDVAAGRAIVKGTSVANQGSYIVQSTAVENVTIATANATNPRIDLIVARVFDKQVDGGTAYNWRPTAVTGTPAASPVAPALPPNSLVLAEVRVNANAASVVTSNITERRVLSGTGDVPKWDYNGTSATPQSCASGTTVRYVPQNTFQLIGMGTTANFGEVVCVTPGRYAVHFAVRLGGSAAVGARMSSMELRSAAGALLRRIANSGNLAASVPVGAAGTIYMRVGEKLTAHFFHDSGQTLSIDDGLFDANFTGVWIGP